MAKTKKKANLKRVHKELLVGFVKNLQTLNKIEAPELDTPIDIILKDPKKFATDYMEQAFADNFDKFEEAYNLGKEYSLANSGYKEKNGKRYYLDGTLIDEKLPSGYEYGGTLNNPDQMCSNCKYFVRDYCAFWDADVRKEFWCKKWQEE